MAKSRRTSEKPPSRRTQAPPDGENGPYILAIHAPGRRVEAITLAPGEVYAVGRQASGEVVLDYPWVSERHAVITAHAPPAPPHIVDVGSLNATFVDGQALTPQVPRSLPAGTVIAIGGVTLVVARGELPASAVMRRVIPFGPDSSEGARDGHRIAQREAPLVIRDRGMLDLYAFVQQIAPSSASVLITGETGVGKELMAQAIHRCSPRAQRELVILNCAAIPENLVESELFGYERGAFSGAATAKPGLFETAHGSTFFLDEVGELSASVQAKLLRVLETGDVSRLGAVRPTRVNVRIVSATNRHLPTQVARGAFRADLFYRLNGLTIAIPPLRDRPDDIAELALHFAASSADGERVEFSPAALAALRAHLWPGNVRELKSVVERAVLIKRGQLIEAADLTLDPATSVQHAGAQERAGDALAAEGDSAEQFSDEERTTEVVLADLKRRARRRMIEALERTAGNQTEAARLLGISRRTLMNRMDRFGISRPRKGPGRNDDG
jgi:DNA-binding NtrC family response regulator